MIGPARSARRFDLCKPRFHQPEQLTNRPFSLLRWSPKGEPEDEDDRLPTPDAYFGYEVLNEGLTPTVGPGRPR